MKWSLFEIVRLLPEVAMMLATLMMSLLLMLRLLEQTTDPPVDDASVRFPVVVTVTLQPATLFTLEMLNPDIFKNPMFDKTMLPPVVDESTRLLFAWTFDTLKRILLHIFTLPFKTASFAFSMMLLNGSAFSVRVEAEEMEVQLDMALLLIFIVPAIPIVGEVKVIFAPVFDAEIDILAFELEAVTLRLHVRLFRFKSPPNLL